MTARRGSLRFAMARRSGALQKHIRGITRVASRVVAGAAALFLAGAFGAQMWHVGAQNYRLHKQVETVERRNDALVGQASKLRREITLLHDPDYLVPLIHEQLGLVKPHEVFIEIQPTPLPASK